MEMSWLLTVVFTPMLFQLCATTWQIRSLSVLPVDVPELDLKWLDVAVANVRVIGRHRAFQDAVGAGRQPSLGQQRLGLLQVVGSRLDDRIVGPGARRLIGDAGQRATLEAACR